ncbi:hypothetical protein H2203_000247 [Taxawa tesnikishii (nom. ined.)]|nr:hypothetical protein H2203_000247 [Dothideales sp. JES 119]
MSPFEENQYSPQREPSNQIPPGPPRLSLHKCRCRCCGCACASSRGNDEQRDPDDTTDTQSTQSWDSTGSTETAAVNGQEGDEHHDGALHDTPMPLTFRERLEIFERLAEHDTTYVPGYVIVGFRTPLTPPRASADLPSRTFSMVNEAGSSGPQSMTSSARDSYAWLRTQSATELLPSVGAVVECLSVRAPLVLGLEPRYCRRLEIGGDEGERDGG